MAKNIVSVFQRTSDRKWVIEVGGLDHSNFAFEIECDEFPAIYVPKESIIKDNENEVDAKVTLKSVQIRQPCKHCGCTDYDS